MQSECELPGRGNKVLSSNRSRHSMADSLCKKSWKDVERQADHWIAQTGA